MAFASQLLPAVIGVGSFMLLVRGAGAEALGEYVMYMAAVILFEMVKSGGLQSAMVMRLSGAGKRQQHAIIGSAYWLGGIFSLGISLILASIYFSEFITLQPGIKIFCGYYAVLGLITLPLHIAEANAVARQNIRFLLWLRISQSGNALIIALYAFFIGGHLREFATIHLLFTTLLMLVIVLSGLTNPLVIKKKSAAETKSLLGLIRYTLATLAATNLLKSADTFLIGSLLGPRAVAAYAIPLKLTELFEIPLRSLSTTAFPQMAAAKNEKKSQGFKDTFVQYLSWAYMLYIPALIVAFIFAPFIVTIFGGAQYAETANVFRVFCLYGLILPADRMTGLGLDALQKPDKNLVKVLCMAIVNIGADYVAIRFSGALEWVAFASVLNSATGAIIGFILLKKIMGVPGNKISNECVTYCTTFMKKSWQRLNKAA